MRRPAAHSRRHAEKCGQASLGVRLCANPGLWRCKVWRSYEHHTEHCHSLRPPALLISTRLVGGENGEGVGRCELPAAYTPKWRTSVTLSALVRVFQSVAVQGVSTRLAPPQP